jgi:two-component system, response regulator / RNA-binding antiterminator
MNKHDQIVFLNRRILLLRYLGRFLHQCPVLGKNCGMLSTFRVFSTRHSGGVRMSDSASAKPNSQQLECRQPAIKWRYLNERSLSMDQSAPPPTKERLAELLVSVLLPCRYIWVYAATHHERAPMRIVIVDESAARAAVIQEGLFEAGLTDIIVLTVRAGLVKRIEAISPDVVLIDLCNPRRDELEEMFAVSRALARPIAMFVDQTDDAAIEAAIDAGVSAYVVDGLKKERIKSVLDVAIKRFAAFSRLRTELDEARGALAERTTLDAAKLLLMKTRGLDEPSAYAALRKAAMDSGRRIVDVADALLTAEKLMRNL